MAKPPPGFAMAATVVGANLYLDLEGNVMVSTTNAEMDPCPWLQNEKVFLKMWYPDSTGCSHGA